MPARSNDGSQSSSRISSSSPENSLTGGAFPRRTVAGTIGVVDSDEAVGSGDVVDGNTVGGVAAEVVEVGVGVVTVAVGLAAVGAGLVSVAVAGTNDAAVEDSTVERTGGVAVPLPRGGSRTAAASRSAIL